MAYRLYNKFPEDLQRGRRAIGVSLPFTGDAVFNPTYTTKDQIKSNLINYFLTNKGERVFNPFFGANLRARLYDPLTGGNANALKSQIENDLKSFFPLVSILKLDVVSNENENSFNVTLTYNVTNFGITDNINLQVE